MHTHTHTHTHSLSPSGTHMELELPDMNLSNENYIYCLKETAYHLEVLTLKWVIVKDHYFFSKLVLLQEEALSILLRSFLLKCNFMRFRILCPAFLIKIIE